MPHEKTFIGKHDPAWGEVYCLVASPSNSGFCYIARNRNGDERFIFENKIAVEFDRFGRKQFALSPDGKKLAIATQIYKEDLGRCESVISINGVEKYRTDLELVYRLHWLGNDRLLWTGWTNNNSGHIDDRGIRVFDNWNEVTGNLNFENVLLDHRMTEGVYVRENGFVKLYSDDGVVLESIPDNGGKLMFDARRDCGLDAPKNELPQLIWNNGNPWEGDRRDYNLTYHGRSLPIFDAIHRENGMPEYAFSEDRSKVAYIGVNYSWFARNLGKAVGKGCAWGEKGEDKKVKGFGKYARLAVMWPLVLLFNPYFGPGNMYLETAKRYYPVNDGKVWKRGYVFAWNHFFIPSGELAITAAKSRFGGQYVVVEEEEGPEFDEVYNVLWVSAENRLSYIGRRGNDFYRVTVK